jgi:hypothetical protein
MSMLISRLEDAICKSKRALLWYWIDCTEYGVFVEPGEDEMEMGIKMRGKSGRVWRQVPRGIDGVRCQSRDDVDLPTLNC